MAEENEMGHGTGPFSVLLKINVPKSRTSPSFTPGHSESGQTGRQLAGSSEAADRQTAQDRGARKKEERDPALEAPEHKGLEMRPPRWLLVGGAGKKGTKAERSP